MQLLIGRSMIDTIHPCWAVVMLDNLCILGVDVRRWPGYRAGNSLHLTLLISQPCLNIINQ